MTTGQVDTESPQIILVVEDDEALLGLIQKTLSRAGFHTKGISNGTEAVTWILDNPDTLLILDYRLLDMTGREFIKTLEELKLSIPFIIMTGHGDEKLAVEMMKLGARDYVVKDSTFLDLLPQMVKSVTEQLATEKKLIKAEEALRFSGAAFKSIQQSVVATNTEYTITRWNEVSESIYLVKASEAVGKKLFDVIEIVENSPGENRKRFKELETGGYYREEQLQRTNNVEVWVDVCVQSIEDKGKRYGWVALASDITKRKRAEAEIEAKNQKLEEANARLKELDRLKSIFLASMSHELRTPLNSILGFTSLILQGMVGEINDEQRSQLILVKNSADHLLSLINDILDISKIEAGKIELSLEEFKLDDLTSEVIETLSPAAGLKGIDIVTDIPKGTTLFCDRRRLKQVLINIMGNAVKFTTEGHVKVTGKPLENDQFEISVIDTGVGIKEEDMDKLFVPFQQVDASLMKKSDGTGLGLYLSKKLVNLLGGTIQAESEHGKGSKFSFTIPLYCTGEKK